MKLYEIDRALFDVIERGYSVDEDTGEILFDWSDLDELKARWSEKMEGCAIVVKGMQAEADAIKAERDRLDARLKAKQRKIEGLRAYMASSMKLNGESVLETPRATMRLRSTEYVDVLDAAALPFEYQRRKVTVTADKTELKNALKDGERIPGACIMTRESVTIK